MKVPFQLRKRAETAPAVALLVPSHAPADVLAVCGRLGCDPLPDIYPVEEGFLLKFVPASGGRQPPDRLTSEG